MRPEFVFLAIGISFLFEFSYFFFVQYIQKNKNKKLARIANTFLYEVTPRFHEKTSFINYVLLFGIIVSLFPFIYYIVYTCNTYSVTVMVIAAILMFVLATIPFIGLDKLREHLFLDILALILLIALFGMEAFYSFQMYRLYLDDFALAAMIVALVLFAFALVMIINPKLFDLKNDMDEEGNPTRKKVIFLALSEWLFYPLSILSLVPLLLLRMN